MAALPELSSQFDLHSDEAMADADANSLVETLLNVDNPPEEDSMASANVKLELKALSLLSAPVIVQLGALYAIIVVNQYFIGHLGAAPLAAAAIGNTVRHRLGHGDALPLLSLSNAWQ